VVSVAGIPALTAIGFAVGALFPGRFITPLVTLAAFFGLGFGTQAPSGDHSYWQISPLLRLGTTAALTAAAAGALAAAGAGAHLAWVGPTAYLLVGTYALYTDWHPPTLGTPWIWPARPPHDLGGALCAAAVFAAGMAVITLRGARESARD
jgi:hypothetical protein